MKRSTPWLSGLLLLVIPCCVQVLAQAPVPTQAIIEVPFELIHGEIVVPVTVNGAGPFWMLLDTGVDPSVVELGTAKSIGLKIDAKGHPGDGGGTSRNLAYKTSLPIVQIGGLTATNVDALALDLSGISAKLGRPIGGILGYSLFKKRIVQIDYPNLKARFNTTAPPCAVAAHSRQAECTKLSFRYKTEILAQGATVDGKPVITNIDTGSNSLFQLTPAAVDKLGLREDVAKAKESSSVGFNGDLKNREGTVTDVTVGTISRNDPMVVFLGKGMGMDKELWDLRIGSEFMKDFVVTLDFRRREVTLTRAVNPQP